jgi:hypothetical protein
MTISQKKPVPVEIRVSKPLGWDVETSTHPKRIRAPKNGALVRIMHAAPQRIHKR